MEEGYIKNYGDEFNMNACEYNEAKKELARSEKMLGKSRHHTPAYKKEFLKFIESLITVKGHAWCMDEKGERKKMARLLNNSLEKLDRPTHHN